MLNRILAALRDPAEFFGWLKTQEPNPGFAFGVLALQAVLANGLLGLTLVNDRFPELEPARAMIAETELSVGAFAAVLVMAAPFFALVMWLMLWASIRIGAGTSERLWEVAAWSQLPLLAILPVQAAMTLPFAGPVIPPQLVTLAGVGWTTIFVYSGVEKLAGGRALPAALVYSAFWLIPPLFGLAANQTGMSSGTMVS